VDQIGKEIERLTDEIIRLRRDFHQNPELGLQEIRTASVISDYLDRCGLSCRHYNKTGLAAVLQGSFPGPTILLRADMDALPVREETGLPFRSTRDGIMHGCGHDAHMAMLLGAAKLLVGKKDKLHGNVKFVFEPNEEHAGALKMIEEGVLEDPPVSCCLAIHVWSPLPVGTIGLQQGPVMAGMKHFTLRVYGKGGHTATPQNAIDPILAASAIVQAVQLVQTRELDALKEPAVIMFGRIEGGTADNVIPDHVTLRGTIRYLSEENEAGESNPLVGFRRVIEGICMTHRTTFELDYTHGHPALYNDPAMVSLLGHRVLEQIDAAPEVTPYVTFAGDDFSEFASRLPGVYCFLGAGKPGRENPPHHHPRFDIDEGVLPQGVEIHVRAALEYLKAK
jgi:amidohydrolase